ncbi:hypothetical protein HDV00_006394 [Rhizophlyctis rosea]|nr:hypothetical protein HDV00_006394 [Rhizophlyctis rosea]
MSEPPPTLLSLPTEILHTILVDYVGDHLLSRAHLSQYASLLHTNKTFRTHLTRLRRQVCLIHAAQIKTLIFHVDDLKAHISTDQLRTAFTNPFLDIHPFIPAIFFRSSDPDFKDLLDKVILPHSKFSYTDIPYKIFCRDGTASSNHVWHSPHNSYGPQPDLSILLKPTVEVGWAAYGVVDDPRDEDEEKMAIKKGTWEYAIQFLGDEITASDECCLVGADGSCKVIR